MKKHFKKLVCPTCDKPGTFTGESDGAYHCPNCDTRVFYNGDKIVKVEEPEKKEVELS